MWASKGGSGFRIRADARGRLWRELGGDKNVGYCELEQMFNFG